MCRSRFRRVKGTEDREISQSTVKLMDILLLLSNKHGGYDFPNVRMNLWRCFDVMNAWSVSVSASASASSLPSHSFSKTRLSLGSLLFASTQRPRRPSPPTCVHTAPLLTLTCDVDVAVRCSMSNVLSTTLRNSNNAVHVPNLQDIITATVGQSRGARRDG